MAACACRCGSRSGSTRSSRTGSRSTSTRVRALLVAAALAALAGGVAWHELGLSGSRPLAWQDLSPQLAGIELPVAVFRVFTSEGALADFQREAEPGVRPRRVEVDFTRRKLVFVSPGPRSSTGYGVEVLGVVERRRSVLVRVRELSPSLGRPGEARVTYPYRLIAIPRTDKPTRIEWEGH